MKASGETKLLIILGAIVMLGAGSLFGLDILSKNNPVNQATPLPDVKMDAAKFDDLVKTARHIEEDPGAEVTIIEFADFECGSCRRTYQGSLSKLLDDPKRPVRLVFRHFPLESEHKFAVPAAIAAEAADRQGKFWPMYRQLFTRTAEEPLDIERIKDSAKLAGLDLVKFEKDVADPALKQLVKDDQKIAEDNKLMYTPTFLIRDKSGKITTAIGNDGLQKAIDGLFSPTSAPSSSAGSEAAPSGPGVSPVPAASPSVPAGPAAPSAKTP